MATTYKVEILGKVEMFEDNNKKIQNQQIYVKCLMTAILLPDYHPPAWLILV